jgi:hypothetical protein
LRTAGLLFWRFSRQQLASAGLFAQQMTKLFAGLPAVGLGHAQERPRFTLIQRDKDSTGVHSRPPQNHKNHYPAVQDSGFLYR